MLPSATSTFLPSSSISIMVSGALRLGRLRAPTGIGRCGIGERAGPRLATLVFDVIDELVAEVLDHRAHRHRSGVAERADRAAEDVAGDRVEQVDVLRPSVAV